MRKPVTLFRLAALTLTLLTGSRLTAQTTGSFNQDITFMGNNRQLSCYVPPAYTPAVPMKLMIGLHGLGDASVAYRNALVNSLGFAAAIPNTILICPDGGTDALSDFYTPAGDEAVIQAAIDFARDNYNIDTTNIVLQGFSLGGRSALRYGLNHTGQFKGLLLNTPAVQGVKEAVATWTGAGLYNYAEAPEIPIYITHGIADELYTAPIDSTYEQLVLHDGMLKLVRFNGAHTVPQLATIQDFNTFFNQPAVSGADAQLVKVTVAPRSCNTSVPATLLVHNTGAVPLTSISFSYVWNGTPQQYTWNGSLNSLTHAQISLPAFTATAGNHVLKVSIDSVNGAPDNLVANNKDSTSFRITGTAATLPLREKFNDETYNDRWLTQRSGDFIIPWSWDEDSLLIATLNTIFVFENSNRREEVLSPVLDLTTLSSPYLAFDVAFNYTTFSEDFFGVDTAFSDTLQVLVSTDCGATYQPVYKKSGAVLATFSAPIHNPASLEDYFLLPKRSDWRRETIDLSAYASSKEAIVKFSYISGLGGIIFMDNISFENTATGIAEKDKSKVTLYPNPARDQVILNTGDAALESVAVSDLSGRSLLQVQGQGKKTATVSTATLPNGVYLFTIATSKDKVTQKVVVHH